MKRCNNAYSLMELLACIAIIAALATVSIIYVAAYIPYAKQQADKQTLQVLNEALIKYKTQGGDLNALTSGAPISHVLEKMKSPLVWNGLQYQVIQTGVTYPASNLTASGERDRYQFTRFGNHTTDSDLTSGLVGWWKFDEGSGTTANDSSGCGNNGILTGSPLPTWTAGKIGGALAYDGSPHYVNVGNGAIPQITNTMTVATWVNFNNLDYSTNTGRLLSIAGKGYPDTTLPHSGWWFSYDNRNNNRHFNYTCFGNSAGGFSGGGNSFSNVAYSNTFTPGLWYHLAFTVTPTRARLYINGTQKGPDKAINGLQLSNPSAPLLLGNNGGFVFEGLLDDIRIYNRELSPTEIRDLYNLP